MYNVEYAFPSTHDLSDEYWDSQAVYSLEEAAKIIFRTNPPKWEVLDENNNDCSHKVKRLIKEVNQASA